MFSCENINNVLSRMLKLLISPASLRIINTVGIEESHYICREETKYHGSMYM